MRRQHCALILAVAFAAASAAPAYAWPYEVAAKWIEHRSSLSKELRPLADIRFDYASYVPGMGVLVNGKVILRIDDEGKPHVMLGTDEPAPKMRGTPTAVTWAPKAGLMMVVGSGWTTKYEEKRGWLRRIHIVFHDFLLQKRDKWRVAPMPKVPGASGASGEWTMWWLVPARDGGVFALVHDAGPMHVHRDLPRPRLEGVEWISRLYHFDGDEWQDLTPAGTGLVEFRSICRLSDHEIVLVGRTVKVRADGLLDRFDPWATVYDETTGEFTELPAPPLPDAPRVLRARLEEAACDAERGRLWASVDYVTREPTPEHLDLFSLEESRLYLYEGGAWRGFDLPPRAPEEVTDPGSAFRTVEAMAVDPGGNPWLALRTERDTTEPLLQFVSGQWRSYPAPKIEGLSRYYVTSIAFDRRGEGWATVHGSRLLLRFRGERWEAQNWIWSWWRERGLGLRNITRLLFPFP